MKAIFDALNVIYDEREKRGLVRLNLISLLFTVGAIAVALLATAAVVVFLSSWRALPSRWSIGLSSAICDGRHCSLS
jgi:uncharacterized BrkB/YihY/UPF0761 family membrane protein